MTTDPAAPVPMLTVGALVALLAGAPPDAWVCLNGFGPALQVVRELGASEPFVVIEGTGALVAP